MLHRLRMRFLPLGVAADSSVFGVEDSGAGSDKGSTHVIEPAIMPKECASRLDV
jgi:hypothetical protein